jgi:hypothetical protein
LPEFDWEGAASNWVRAAEPATRPEARAAKLNRTYYDWTINLVDSAEHGVGLARAIAQQTAAADLDGPAAVWRAATVSWELAADSVREAAQTGWTASGARAISVAAKATAQGAGESAKVPEGVTPDPAIAARARTIEAAWAKAGTIWESASEYIAGEFAAEAAAKKPLSGSSAEPSAGGPRPELSGIATRESNTVTFHKISADACYESTLEKTWDPATLQYFEAKFRDYKSGDCASNGFTEAGRVKTEIIPMLGEFIVFSFKKPAQGDYYSAQVIRPLSGILRIPALAFFSGGIFLAAARAHLFRTSAAGYVDATSCSHSLGRALIQC